MILKRKIYQRLARWKQESRGRSALLLDGARRVGKSFVCRQFAEREYASHLIIDFANIAPEIRELFLKETYDLDLFFARLSAFYRVTLHRRRSLVVFDEVQQLPAARQLVKYLVADGRYDYLETGSLLSLKTSVGEIVIPSEEEHVPLRPLDFEEFLWAMGDEATAPALRAFYEKRIPLGQSLHRRVLNDFRQYLLVGGMPQAVLAYVKNKNFAAADKIKRAILALYRSDIGKFAKGYESRVEAVFDQIPGQLAKKEKVYRLSALGRQARMRTYEDAFLWLADAMIVNPCFNATDPHAGLALSRENNTWKCYMADTGLLVTHAFNDGAYADNDLYRAVLFDRLNINEGMLMENAAAQMLCANGRKLYFYSRRDRARRENTMEIDFLLRRGRKICPVEVKSSSYQAHSSLDKFRAKFAPAVGECIVLYQKDIMVKDGVLHLPLYMGMFL